jgi:hypothetical protein
MFDRSLARRLALGRLAVGAAFAAAPGAASGPLVPREEAQQRWPRLLARMLGIREIALAVLTLRAIRSGRDARLVLALAAICDTVDGVAALTDATLPTALQATFAGAAFPTAAIELLMVLTGLD